LFESNRKNTVNSSLFSGTSMSSGASLNVTIASLQPAGRTGPPSPSIPKSVFVNKDTPSAVTPGMLSSMYSLESIWTITFKAPAKLKPSMTGNDMAGAMVNVGCAYMYNIRYKKFKFSNSLFTYYVGDTYYRDARAH
jgi:hypothetical protein